MHLQKIQKIMSIKHIGVLQLLVLHSLEPGQCILNIAVVGDQAGPEHQHMKQCIQWAAIMNRLDLTETLTLLLIRTAVSKILYFV